MVRKVLKASHTQHAQSPTISAVIFILTVPFQSCFGHSPTNGSHSLSLPKAGTHSPAPAKSHTAAYTAKQGAFRVGALLLPSERFARFGNPARPGIRTAYFAAFGSWSRGISKNAESLRDSDAFMRVAVPRRRGPAGLRDPVAVSLTALMGFTVLLSRFVGTQKIERLFFSWYKISIAPEAYRKPRRLCLFLL